MLIKLQTTDASTIPMHLAANGRCRTCDKLNPYVQPPDDMDWGTTSRCECDEPNPVPIIEPPSHFYGKTVAICGAGPSLKEQYKIVRKADHVWGCNRAANYLSDWGWKLTHAFGIDAGTGMFEDCWLDPPKVSEQYLLATSVHPRLVDHILEAGNDVRLFHSVRGGVKDEMKLFNLLYPPAPVAGNGLNSVNRALGLAAQLGYRHAWICGADNALSGDAFYADGSPKTSDPNVKYFTGTVHGRQWKTTIDMLMSACDLARIKWQYGDWLTLVGNTLPRALSRTSEAFLDRCARWAKPEELPNGNVAEATVAKATVALVD